jgi:hypothetical protein
LFIVNIDFEDDTNIHDIAIKYKSLLMELWDFQLHALMVKLGRAMNPHDDNWNIKKVMRIAIGNGAYFYILALHYFFPIVLLAMFIGNVCVFLLGIFCLLL